ncbi:MAG: trypsin-like peptidase domain-containing protein [Candidatus Latescibacterota bacterium]|jgi:serine protease Do
MRAAGWSIRAAVLAVALVVAPDGGAQTDGIAASRRTAVVQAVERTQPAVVSVHVTYRERVLRRVADPFWDMFSFVVPEDRERISSGSGVIVGTDGYILTNRHVVQDPERVLGISITLPDGRNLEAGHVASDIAFDLAALRVKETGLPVAPLGDSSDILVGEWAVAIGNPFDLGPTVSIGVVSALHRDFPEQQGSYYYLDMIQTDAAINPGNSGGPLVNALGQVIGINSFIYTGGDYSIGSIGIGFAVPINTARAFLQEVRTHGKVRESWTGIVYVQPLTRALAQYLSLPSMEGAYVAQVAERSPASRAGVERGDVITAVNDRKIHSIDDALALIRAHRVGEVCALTVVRQGRSIGLRLLVEEYPRGRRRD